MKRRWGLIFDIVLFFLSLGVLGAHYTSLVSQTAEGWIVVVVGVVATAPVLVSAVRALTNRKITVDLLASIALVASLLAREWASVVFINLMLTSARILGRYTDSQAWRAIRSLLKLRPQKIRVKRGSQVVMERVENVRVDDIIVVESGERIPVDGIIEHGDASIDQSSLTGESMPVSRTKGREVFSSTLVVSGSLLVRVRKVGRDTALEKIIALVETSQKDKAGITTVTDRFAVWYIVVTILAVVGVYIAVRDTQLVLSMLLVACADDVAVAIPLAFLAAIGHAARRGIIIKGGSYLEGIIKTGTMLLDKTGTLTQGKLRVQEIRAFGDHGEERVMRLGAMVEFFSNHPAAKAIVSFVQERRVVFEKPNDFKEIPGRGSTAIYENEPVMVGKTSFLKELGVPVTTEQESAVRQAQERGLSVTSVGYDGELVGFFALADQVRPEAEGVIADLKTLGVKSVVMLTGDNERVAKRIADVLGIGTYHANLLPEDKLRYIKQYVNKRAKVAMVGDGVNDAAALSLADIGIAMGVIGSDAAIEAADIALMSDNLKKIPETMRLGRTTVRIAYENLWIWGAVTVVGLVLVFGGAVGPQGAAAYNFFTDFLPLINSMRLFRMRTPKM